MWDWEMGDRVRTGGESKRSMAWSSQMMLSSQRPYTSSSLSMGKMENQGASSSWEAAEEHRGGRIAQSRGPVTPASLHFGFPEDGGAGLWYEKGTAAPSPARGRPGLAVPWWSWLCLSRLDPESEGGLGMGGGVGGTSWELLLLRPGGGRRQTHTEKTKRLECLAPDYSSEGGIAV